MLCHYYKMFVLLLFGLLFVGGARSGFLVSGPEFGDPRREIALHCRYASVLEPPLHSVKWYYHIHEIFRYLPGQQPQTRIFNTTGGSGVTRGSCDLESCTIYVRLSKHRYNSRLSYTCEVSTEGPRFEVAKETINITVAVALESPPVIRGIPINVGPGQELELNCSTGPAMPPANINWYIDGLKQPAEESTETRVVGDLRASWRPLRFRTPSSRSEIHIRCEASQPVLPPLRRETNATLVISRTTHLSMFMSSGCAKSCTREAALLGMLSAVVVDVFTRYSAFTYVV